MRRFGILAHQGLLLFALLGAVFIPFSFRGLQVQSKITQCIFEDVILSFASLFKLAYVANSAVSSDSTTLYLLVVLLFLVGVFLAVVFSIIHVWKRHSLRFVQAIHLVLTFYLSIVMLKYGIDKVFKAQFYLPEPNTLYTPLGLLDKDILYWSTMGTSHTYNVFMGLLEIIPAVFLLFRSTRIMGLFALAGVLLNVVFINFGFDISVKLYSSFLLFLCCLLLAPSMNALFHFFVLNKSASLACATGKNLVISSPKRIAFKTTIIFVFFVESLFPYILNGLFNDDNMPRNYLHGAYEIFEVTKNDEDANTVNLNLKRLFVHRHNYLIFQYDDDSMEDFHLEIDPDQHQFLLTNYDGEIIFLEYKYLETQKILELKSPDLGLTIYSKSLPWRDLPLLQPLFHWTVDIVQ